MTLAERIHDALALDYGCRHPMYQTPQCEVVAARLVPVVVKHAIGEPCGDWAGGAFICGCSSPVPGQSGCVNCGHRLEAIA